jgi:excisionase family DNA binding protein
VDQVLTADEVAKLLRVTTVTICRLARRGKIPAYKEGGDWRFSSKAIENWMERTNPIDDDSEQS